MCDTPQSMAAAFGVEYLGKLPMDKNMLKACENGESFLVNYPNSPAAAPFTQIVKKIVDITSKSV